MESKEALKKLFFDNKDLKVDITLNDRKVCEIYNIISYDLERFEECKNENCNYQIENAELQQENEKLKQAIDILKDTFRIEGVYKDDGYYAIDCVETHYLLKNKEQYNLLKEALNYEN